MCGQQSLLAAPSGWMRRIPISIAAAVAIGKTDLRFFPRVGSECHAIGVTRPVAARVIGRVRKSSAIRLRARQHLVLVTTRPGAFRVFTQARNDLALLRERGHFVQIAAETGKFDGVPVQIGKIMSDHFPFGVVPGSLPNPVPRIDRRLTVLGLRAEVCVPGVIASPHYGSKRLAVRVRAGQTAEVRPFAQPHAGDEECHWMLRGILLRERQV